MGIFSRMVTLIKSNINDLIDKAEDPEKNVESINFGDARAVYRSQKTNCTSNSR